MNLAHESYGPTIVVADAEAEQRQLVRQALGEHGFTVVEVEASEDPVRIIREVEPSLAIMDLRQPRLSGLEVCRALRADPAVADLPIVILTGCTGEADRLAAFELGVDDYVTKPFSPRELVLRVKAILRGRRAQKAGGAVLQCGLIALDEGRHTVSVQDHPVDLTATEYRLLLALMAAGGRVRSRRELMRELRGEADSIESRSVDTQVRRLRDKLGRAGEQIHTVRGFGYQLTERLP